MHGLHTLRLDEEVPLVDMVVSAARDIVTGLAEPHRVRYVIHARAIHQVAPPTTDIARQVAPPPPAGAAPPTPATGCWW